MLCNGIIETSVSHWDSPIVLLTKADNTLIKPPQNTITLRPTSRILWTRYIVTTYLPPLTS